MRSRLALGAYFFLHGVASSSWLYQASLSGSLLKADVLLVGLVLTLSVAAVPVGMPLGTWLIGEWGARRVTVWATVTFSLVLGGSAFAGSVAVLCLATVVVGLASGALLVAMNTLAAGLERDTGRLLLPWCHGWLALGGFVGSGLAVQLLRAFFPQVELLLWTAAVCIAVAVGLAKLLPEAELPDTRPRLPRNFVLLAVVAFAALMAADVVRTSWWLFRETMSELPLVAYTLVGAQTFTLGVALGGFAGGPLAARIGVRHLLNTAAGVTALGLLWLVFVPPTPGLAAVGLLITGFGLSCVFPVVLSLAAAQGSARHAIAAVAAVGYVAAQAGSRLFVLLVLDVHHALVYLLVVPVLLAAVSAAVASRDRAGT